MKSHSAAGEPAQSFEVATWVHLLGGFVTRRKTLWTWLGNWETGLLGDALAGIEVRSPVYVTALARAGSTLLLEILNRHPDLTAHRYQDFPFLFTPYFWNRYLELTPRSNTLSQERTHRDGIFVTPESPEAFEEVLWMAFFPDLHTPGRTALLNERTENPAFETFYRDHIRKLLLVRDGRRYLAKGNYNITRLPYLRKIFSDARIVIPIREPIWHIASLINQHSRFCRGQRLNPRALTHMQRIGHFEFGLDLRPIQAGDPQQWTYIDELWKNGADVEGWATYWAMIHDFLADRLASDPGLRAAIKIIRYEDLGRHPREGVQALFDHCRLTADEPFLDATAAMIRPPVLRRPEIFSRADLALIERCTAASAQRLGLGRRQPVTPLQTV